MLLLLELWYLEHSFFGRKTAMDILKQVRERIDNPECSRESSYGMFLHLLGKYFAPLWDILYV